MAGFQTNKKLLWKVFTRIVEMTLFFKLLALVLPFGLRALATTLEVCVAPLEAHATTFALVSGIVVGVTPEAVTLFRKRKNQISNARKGGEKLMRDPKTSSSRTQKPSTRARKNKGVISKSAP